MTILTKAIYRVNAAAAKSLQSCPTLCDPIDGSPPGFPVSGILQARTLEWVAIAFSIESSGIFHRSRTNNFLVCMEKQKNPNSQSNSEKEKTGLGELDSMSSGYTTKPQSSEL